MKVKIGKYVSRWNSGIYDRYVELKYNDWVEPKNFQDRVWKKIDSCFQTIYDCTVNLYLDRKRRKIYIKIHDYDTWSMDDTLAHIILPMLRQLKQTAHGSPYVDDADVPDYLKSTAAAPKEYAWDVDDNHHARWQWVLDEMIFAFESKITDDCEEMEAYQTRISNGFRLFGKYYEALWD
jgi:hypothetical protein